MQLEKILKEFKKYLICDEREPATVQMSLRMMWILLQTCLIAVRVNPLAGKLLKKFFFITRCS